MTVVLFGSIKKSSRFIYKNNAVQIQIPLNGMVGTYAPIYMAHIPGDLNLQN
jgi:hypothetical protein